MSAGGAGSADCDVLELFPHYSLSNFHKHFHAVCVAVPDAACNRSCCMLCAVASDSLRRHSGSTLCSSWQRASTTRYNARVLCFAAIVGS
jgi:hypothetical protein